MKTTFLLLVLLFLSPSFSHSAVFIYDNKLSATLTGGGTVIKHAISGYTLTETDTGTVVQLTAIPSTKTFTFGSNTNIFLQAVSAGKKTYLTLLQAGGYTDAQSFNHVETGALKGEYVSVKINQSIWSIPKTFSWIGHSVFPSGGTTILQESTGTFVLNVAATSISQSDGETLSAATTRMINLLLSEGYTQQ